MNSLLFDIASVERDTGIGKDTLRVWERRYGFPIPVLDERDERLYPQLQVEQLRLIKLLLSNGLRPAKVVGLSLEELHDLLPQAVPVASEYSPEVVALAELIKTHQALSLRIRLNRLLLQLGLDDFLSKTLIPLNRLVGEAWMRNEIRIFEEHLYSDQIVHVLRNAISGIHDATASPRILLTTLPGEEHSLGLLMAQAILSMAGANCVMLGTQTPAQEIVGASAAHQADIVVLSFSAAFGGPQAKTGLQQMRQALPPAVALWAGGAGAKPLRDAIDGVEIMDPLHELSAALNAWRAAHA